MMMTRLVAVRSTSLLFLTTVLLTGCGVNGALTFNSTQPPQIFSEVTQTSHPLVASCTIHVSEPASVYVEFGPDLDHLRQTSSRETIAVQPVKILVAGMKASTTYHIRPVVTTANGTYHGQDHLFTTGEPPPQAVPQVKVIAAGTPMPGVELLDMTVPNGVFQAAVLDLDGSLIWYYANDQSVGFPYPIRPMPNGDILITIGTQLLREVDLAGTAVQELTPGVLNSRLASSHSSLQVSGFHHEAFPLANGHTILLCEEQRSVSLGGSTTLTLVRGDALVDLDPAFQPQWTWSSFDHLDVARHPMDVEDWTHGNGLLYSATDGALLLSMRNQHWILKLNYADGMGDGSILWRLGPNGDFTLVNGNGDGWFYGQHFPSFDQSADASGRIAVFDNRATNQAGTTCATDTGQCFSRAAIFQLDEAARLASVSWQDPLDHYSLWGGSIQTLGNHVEFLLSNPFLGLGSRITEVDRDTKTVLWQMDILGQLAYRGYRIPSLYPGVQW